MNTYRIVVITADDSGARSVHDIFERTFENTHQKHTAFQRFVKRTLVRNALLTNKTVTLQSCTVGQETVTTLNKKWTVPEKYQG